MHSVKVQERQLSSHTKEPKKDKCQDQLKNKLQTERLNRPRSKPDKRRWPKTARRFRNWMRRSTARLLPLCVFRFSNCGMRLLSDSSSARTLRRRKRSSDGLNVSKRTQQHKRR